jgi:hypothetical protein
MVTCTWGSLGAGSSATVTVTYDVKASAKPPLTILNIASADDSSGNHVEASDTVEVIDDCGAPPELDLESEVVDSPDLREACRSISAGPSFEVMAPPSGLTLRAGEVIVLENGFEVGNGAVFTAEIDPALSGN